MVNLVKLEANLGLRKKYLNNYCHCQKTKRDFSTQGIFYVYDKNNGKLSFKTKKTGRCIMSMSGQPFLPSVKGLLQEED